MIQRISGFAVADPDKPIVLPEELPLEEPDSDDPEEPALRPEPDEVREPPPAGR